MSETQFQNYAFISYSHRNIAVAMWLQKKLENFRLPAEAHSDIEGTGRYLRPVFRDQSDLNTGILGDELRRHLAASKFLILICSKSSASSQWVSDEARAFVEMGRLDHIIPVMIPDGSTSERELFPAFLCEYFTDHPDCELLGINIGEVGREKALVRVVSRMLGIEFDALWRRHQRHRCVRILSAITAGTLLAVAAYLFGIPVTMNVDATLEPSTLPNDSAVTLTVDGSTYTAPAVATQFDGIRLPGYRRFSKADISLVSEYFVPVDTAVTPGFGLSRTVSITMRRDDTFASFGGTVFNSDMNPIENVAVTVAGRTVMTDADGRFDIILPLDAQRAEHTVILSKPGYATDTIPYATPSKSLRFILFP